MDLIKKKNNPIMDQFTLSINNARWMYAEEINNCVYFITDGEYVKIGKSKNIKKRLTGLQIGNARPLNVMFVLYLENSLDIEQLERDLHKRFQEKNVSGEWFRLSRDDFYSILKSYEQFVIAVDIHKHKRYSRYTGEKVGVLSPFEGRYAKKCGVKLKYPTWKMEGLKCVNMQH